MFEWIISSSVLIAVVILLRFVLRGRISLRLQYALWALVLVRLLVPFSIGVSSFSVMEQIERTGIYQETTQTITEIQVPSDIIRDSELTYDEAAQAGNGTLHRVEGYPHDSEKGNLHTYSYQDSLQVVGAKMLRIIWLCGLAVVSLWFLFSNLSLYRSLKKNRTVLDSDYALPVYLSSTIDTPCLFGVFSPAIYLTREAIESERTQRHAMEHELTHYRHRDNIWAILRCVCLAVHWFNPLVWWAAMLSRNDAELACDESTILRLGEEERSAYGRTLIRLTCEKHTALLNTATTMTGSGKSIRERIALIAKKPKMAIYTLVAVILVTAVAVGCTFTGAKEQPHSFEEWTESLTVTDIQLASVAKEYGMEKVKHTLSKDEYKDLCALLTVIKDEDCSRKNSEGSNEDGYRLEFYRADRLWLFKCLSDGTVGLMFSDLETGAYFGCEGKLLIINSPELWDYIIRTVEEKGVMDDKVQVQTGLYSSMESYVRHRIEQKKTVSYYSAATQEQVTASVLDTKIAWLEKRGELHGLAPNGVLEAWSYNILVKPDADPADIMLVGGQYDEDGYFDLEGQGGRITVALRDASENYDVLYAAVINDGLDFFGYCNTTEEAIHDWYVKKYNLDLPLYATEWIERITLPEGAHRGNYPVHRYDGDGWYIYIPVQTWVLPSSAETPCVFTSAYYTGSTLKVDYFEYPPEGLADDHRKQGFALIDETNLIWSRSSGGVTTYYYCFDAQDGGCWRVTIEWIDANITDYPYIAMEPDILQLMAESFVVLDQSTGDAEIEKTDPVLQMQSILRDLTSEWQLRFDRNEEPMSFLRVDGNRERELTVEGNMLSVLSAAANNLQKLDDPDDFRALGGGIYVWFDSTRHLAFFAGEEPYQVKIRYVADDTNESAVVNDPQLYLYLTASAERENVQLADLDQDGFFEAMLWQYSENDLIIYDYYGDELHRIDTNRTIGCDASDYTGLIANIKPAYGSMVQGQSADGAVSVYQYKDGAFSYECLISEVLG